MPIYEYQCDHCGVFEVNQRITEDALKKCPTCKGKVRRLISNTSFMLKGSGWYATDYARTNTAPTPSTDSGSGNNSSGGNGKSGESASSSGSSEKSTSEKSTSDKSSSSSSDKATSST